MSDIDAAAILSTTRVRTVEHHAVIESTNRRAMERLQDEPQLPLLVVADEQTAGRGRGSNAWWSPPGCLMFSLVLARHETSAKLPPYSLCVGLGVRAAIAELLVDQDVKVKWPNDVFVGDRKICGILIELPPGDSGKLVVGVGINVNNSTAQAPLDVASTVATLADLGNRTFSRTVVLTSVLNLVAAEIDGVQDDLQTRWLPHCYLSGRSVAVERGNQLDRGVCEGIDASGALLLNTGSGVVPVSSGTVRIEPA